MRQHLRQCSRPVAARGDFLQSSSHQQIPENIYMQSTQNSWLCTECHRPPCRDAMIMISLGRPLMVAISYCNSVLCYHLCSPSSVSQCLLCHLCLLKAVASCLVRGGAAGPGLHALHNGALRGARAAPVRCDAARLQAVGAHGLLNVPLAPQGLVYRVMFVVSALWVCAAYVQPLYAVQMHVPYFHYVVLIELHGLPSCGRSGSLTGPPARRSAISP